jgi:hypothetical protein
MALGFFVISTYAIRSARPATAISPSHTHHRRPRIIRVLRESFEHAEESWSNGGLVV